LPQIRVGVGKGVVIFDAPVWGMIAMRGPVFPEKVGRAGMASI